MLGFIKTDQICAKQKGAEQIIYPRMTAIVSLIVLILALEIFLFEWDLGLSILLVEPELSSLVELFLFPFFNEGGWIRIWVFFFVLLDSFSIVSKGTFSFAWK